MRQRGAKVLRQSQSHANRTDWTITSALARSALGAALAFSVAVAVAGAAPAPKETAGIRRLGAGVQMPTDAANPAIGEDGRVGVMVELKGEPAVAEYRRTLLAGGNGVVAQGAAGAASRRVVGQLRDKQNKLVQAVKAQHIPHDELFRAQRALNGVALRVAPADMARLAALPDVASVKFLPLEQLSNITSVPFINAPQVWSGAATLGLPADATGEGVRVGIIDTGIDYQHPDFGGSGALVDYQRNGDRSHVNPLFFPTAKVVGGTDFVGDQYTGANTPAPDANPMDCNGHGTHVAGTVGGYGVTTNGSPYVSGYDPLPDYTGLRIGPGVAPGAQLYALRVFGCGGGTNVLSQAIEWSMDPNGDDDISDHLDVINMSLGSPLGFPSDVDAIASDNAAEAGVIVVAAAGNDGDAFFTNGSPASARHAISVAAILDSGQAGVLLDETAPAPASFPAATSAFTNPDDSTPPAASGQAGNVVPVQDDSAAPSEGCSATYLVSVAGKIALVDRGDCAFTDKVANAQTNGAIGVVIADNQDSAVPVTAGGSADVPITIPVISVSAATGAQLKTQVQQGAVSVVLSAADAGDTFAQFSSRGPVGDFDGSITLKPDLAAPGFDIPSAQTGVTCNDTFLSSGCITPAVGGYVPGGQLLRLSGTSMATPHVAGMMAVLRQVYPSASVDELKAIAINTALHDVSVGANGSGPRYGARSVGSGRIDVALAATNAVSLNAVDPGAASVTFDVDPVGSSQVTHNVRISNHSNTAQTVDLTLDDVDAAPGVQFSLNGLTTITMPAGGSALAPVTMTTDATLMKRQRDPTIPSVSTLSGPGFTVALPRTFLNETSTLLKLSQSGVEVARLPIYAATRPHSSIHASLPPTSTATTTLDLTLSGSGVCTGALTAEPACAAGPGDELSMVSALELQLSAPKNNALPGFASLHHLGVNRIPDPINGDLLVFGLSTYGKWSSPSLVAYNICIDTDEDGQYDKILYNTDFGALRPTVAGIAPTTSDAYLSVMSDGFFVFFETPLNLIDAGSRDVALLDNNVMLLGTTLADLGITADARIHYGVAVCPAFDPQCTRITLPSAQCNAGDALANFDGPFTYDIGHPGVDGNGNVLLQDLDGAQVQLPYNEANLAANNSLGLLLLHHHNTSDRSAEVVVLDRVFGSAFEATVPAQ